MISFSTVLNEIKRHKVESDRNAFTLKREQSYASKRVEEMVFKRLWVTGVLPKFKIKSFIYLARARTRVSSIENNFLQNS